MRDGFSQCARQWSPQRSVLQTVSGGAVVIALPAVQTSNSRGSFLEGSAKILLPSAGVTHVSGTASLLLHPQPATPNRHLSPSANVVILGIVQTLPVQPAKGV